MASSSQPSFPSQGEEFIARLVGEDSDFELRPILEVSDKLLRPYITTKGQLAILRSKDYVLIHPEIQLSQPFVKHMMDAGGKQEKHLFDTPPYDSRIIDSLIIQSRGICLSPEAALVEYPEEWNVEALGDKDLRCTHCKDGKGMYAHCVALPFFQSGPKCEYFKGVCGNCRRAARAATCDLQKVWKGEEEEISTEKGDDGQIVRKSQKGRELKAPKHYGK